MKRCPYAASVLLLGLLTAQVIATVQVYLSNADLYGALEAISDAGYMAIPNQQVMPHLKAFGSAFFGGLFFTLSVGAGLSLLCLGFASVWVRLFSKNISFLIFSLMLWMASLIIVNYWGLCPSATTYFLIIPPMIFTATLKLMPTETNNGGSLFGMLHALPVFLLAILWAPQMEGNLFLNLRDNLLLSNPLGKRINDFYYTYTLYPAQVFKSLDQKTLKTCNLKELQNRPVQRAVERELINHDYFNVGSYGAVDLAIAEEGQELVLRNRGKPILRTTIKGFLSNSQTVLREFSFKTDKFAFFRQFTFLSLLIGFPLALYVILFALFRTPLTLFLGKRSSSLIASVLCFLVGLTLLIFFHSLKGERIRESNLAEALKSQSWNDRVAALRFIEQKGLEVSNLRGYRRLLKSPHIPERYWLVRTFGVSRRSVTYEDLLAFLDDPHPNVVSMAFYALGRRGDRRAIDEILKRIKTSDDWYNQWHAYRALRALGWKQQESK